MFQHFLPGDCCEKKNQLFQSLNTSPVPATKMNPGMNCMSIWPDLLEKTHPHPQKTFKTIFPAFQKCIFCPPTNCQGDPVGWNLLEATLHHTKKKEWLMGIIPPQSHTQDKPSGTQAPSKNMFFFHILTNDEYKKIEASSMSNKNTNVHLASFFGAFSQKNSPPPSPQLRKPKWCIHWVGYLEGGYPNNQKCGLYQRKHINVGAFRNSPLTSPIHRQVKRKIILGAPRGPQRGIIFQQQWTCAGKRHVGAQSKGTSLKEIPKWEAGKRYSLSRA